MSIYYHHDIGDDLTLWLRLFDPATGNPVLGASPTVTIRRHREARDGPLLDDWYWNGVSFVSAATPLAMTEYGQGNYLYEFAQSRIGLAVVYLVRFESTVAPAIGFDTEEHIFDRRDVIVVEGEPSQ